MLTGRERSTTVTRYDGDLSEGVCYTALVLCL
jgi:hypothetical protein